MSNAKNGIVTWPKMLDRLDKQEERLKGTIGSMKDSICKKIDEKIGGLAKELHACRKNHDGEIDGIHEKVHNLSEYVGSIKAERKTRNTVEKELREQKSFRLKTWHIWLVAIGLLVTIGTSILLAFVK